MAHPMKSAQLRDLAPEAMRQSLIKFAPRSLARNPVIFTTAVVALMTTAPAAARSGNRRGRGLDLAAHLCGCGYACCLPISPKPWPKGAARQGRHAARHQDHHAGACWRDRPPPSTRRHGRNRTNCAPASLFWLRQVTSSRPTARRRGVASVNESAITGESAPVIREAGGDRSSVTGGTTVASDWLVVRITAEPGKSFLDRMIALVEGAERQKTPNEIALNILLAGLTLIFLFVVVTLPAFASFAGLRIPVIVLGALFVTLIPTTIGGLLSSIGIAGWTGW